MTFLYFGKAEFVQMNHHLSAMFSSNVLKPIIGGRYRLEEAGKAQHDVIESSGAAGRLTLLIDE